MDVILREIERALEARLYYLAVLSAIALPDVCSALQSDGTTKPEKYKAWYEAWLAKKLSSMTSDDMYGLRCGIVHQGIFGHPGMQYNRVIFTVPHGRVRAHNTVMRAADDEQFALHLDAEMFCLDVIASVKEWYSSNQDSPNVKAHLPRLVQYRPGGLPPYILGSPVIA
jgi:hypothetical protein